MVTYEHNPSLAADGIAIKDASDLLGVPAPTLRSWERRYGVPTTSRSAGGHRRYTTGALDQLRLMRDEIAMGRSAADSARRVRGLLDETNPFRDRIDALMAGSDKLDSVAITSVLQRAYDELGLAATLDEVVLPSIRQIGSWWEKERSEVGQEHFTTEVVRGWLARIIAAAPPTGAGGWVILAAGPRDLHTLGIEALAALLVDQGVGCRVLGPRTPQRVLVTATIATAAAAVVVVSDLPTMRRPAVESLRAVAETGCPVFYAGIAFLFASSREDVPGTYLGESISGSAQILRAAVPR